jgi:hypothetical protein
VVPSLDEASSECYVWSYPGCPVRIVISLNVIQQLQAEIAQAVSWPGEIGGLLICSNPSKRGTIRIVDFIPLPRESELSGSPFQLSPEFLAEAIARCPSDNKIAGYYRTDMYQSVLLRPEDLETIEQFFREPTSIFLVIAPSDACQSSAGFFVSENGAVAANPGLTFPFSAPKLLAEGWPTQDSVEKDRFAGFSRRFWQVADILQRASLPMKIGVIGALLALVIGVGVYTWNGSSGQSKAVSPPTLGLQVSRDGAKFLVSWNPSVPELANAKDANLVIWDESRQAWDGNSEPLYLPLSSAQLRSGKVTYTSFGFAEKVKFRLETAAAGGNGASESTISISYVPNSAPAPIPTREPTAISAPSGTPVVSALPAAESPPPEHPAFRRSTGTTPLTRADRSVRTSSLVSRTFVPPKSVQIPNMAGDTMMSDPPNLVTDLPSRAPLSINPGFNPNAVATIAPPDGQSKAGTPLGARLPPSATVAPPSRQSNEGVINITSEPSGAKVEINAIPAGVTPLAVQISPLGLGFTVTVTKNGYMKWTVQTFSTAQPCSLHAQLRQIP